MTDFITYFFAIIGAVVSLATIHGAALNGIECLIAVDKWAATCLFHGVCADETISAAAHRRNWKRTERFINWLFSDDLHCARSYVSEMVGTQNSPIYRKE